MNIETAHALTRHEAAPSWSRLELVIGIPSAGRRDIIGEVMPLIAQQTRLPDEIVICVPTSDDVDEKALSRLPCPVRVIVSQRGLCRQRNAILNALSEADIVLFLDDDFLLGPSYLAEMEQLYLKNPDVEIVTGTVIADGINGPGIPVSEGVDLLRNAELPAEQTSTVETYSGYGCNLAVRMSTVRICGLRFDENLPFYGWLEDVDFSRTVGRLGRIITSPRLIGVHLGTKIGRTSGLRFGYSQIANPLYLMQKGTMSPRHALSQMARNLAANLVKAWSPEPWIDRKSRLRGNLLALRDLLARRLAPQNIEMLD